jgi:hypothetical protein
LEGSFSFFVFLYIGVRTLEELETLDDFRSGVFQEYYFFCEATGTGFVFYNED